MMRLKAHEEGGNAGDDATRQADLIDDGNDQGSDGEAPEVHEVDGEARGEPVGHDGAFFLHEAADFLSSRDHFNRQCEVTFILATAPVTTPLPATTYNRNFLDLKLGTRLLVHDLYIRIWTDRPAAATARPALAAACITEARRVPVAH